MRRMSSEEDRWNELFWVSIINWTKSYFDVWAENKLIISKLKLKHWRLTVHSELLSWHELKWLKNLRKSDDHIVEEMPEKMQIRCKDWDVDESTYLPRKLTFISLWSTNNLGVVMNVFHQWRLLLKWSC